MSVLTFEQLPHEVAGLKAQIAELTTVIKRWQKPDPPKEEQNPLLSVEGASAFLRLSKATIYSKVSRRELPFMKRGKRLYFSKDELLEYLKDGKKQTLKEMQADADNFLTKRKGGYHNEQ